MMAADHDKELPDALRFTVDSQLVGELGERLVTRNHIALAELVKNAYDADASSITIDFRDRMLRESNCIFPSIALVDNGHGMPFSDVEAYWMRIATSNKARDPFSPAYGRPKTGDKGIGRFACQRLAKYLILNTVAEVDGGFEQTQVTFEWAAFEAGTTLTTIPCKYTTQTLETGTPGTTLELIGLKDVWLERDFNTLRRSISWLTMAREVRREGFDSDPGFSISLNAKQFEQGEGLILDQLVDSGWGRVQARVLPDGRASLTLQGNYLDGEKSWTSDAIFESLGGVSCDISLFTSGEAYPLARNKKILTKKVLSQLREEAGVRVYYEAFRVFPMGERGDDWLGLDRDAAARKGTFTHPALTRIAARLGLDVRTALLRPRNENLLGRVHIGEDAGKALQIKMNREGFVETNSLRELIDFVRLVIDWMTIYYGQARNRFERQRARSAEEAFSREIEALGNSQHRAARLQGPTAALSALDFLVDHALNEEPVYPIPKPQRRALQSGGQVIRTRIGELDSEVAVLRTLASTAPLLFTFAHEVTALIGRLKSSARRIDAMSAQLPADHQVEAAAIAESMRDSAKNFDQVSELFGIVTTARQSRPRRHYVHKLLEKIVAGMYFATAEAGITAEVKCDRDLKSPPIIEAELVSIVVNLYSNAIKSCLAAKRRKPVIQISAFKTRSDFVLEVRDQGVGLPRKRWEEAFEPFCSDPADQIYSSLEARIGESTVSALGRGSGLGLSIVRGICESYKGSVQFSKSKGWSITVTALLPAGGG